MERITDLVLRVGLLLASLGSAYMLTIMILARFLPIEWNRYNALTFFSATVFLAAARYIEGLIRAQPPIPVREQSKHSMAVDGM